MKTFALIALLNLSAPAFSDAFDYGAYRPTQLADVAKALAKVDPQAEYWLDASHPKYSAVVTLTGNRRPIDAGLKTYIGKWLQTMGQPIAYLDMFQTEIEVSQGSANYWVPVQQQLLAPIDEEVAAGKPVRLYILLMGAYKHTPVFSIAEFSLVGS